MVAQRKHNVAALWSMQLRSVDVPSYFVDGSPAAFQALKPPAMERTFL